MKSLEFGGAAPTVTSPPPPDETHARPSRIIGIAASTGGPGALRRLLTGLPASFPAAILVVQHIADGFEEGFAEWLDTFTGMTVKVASARMRLRDGLVLLSGADRHLGLGPGSRAELSNAPPVCGHRPSATHLFDTLANHGGRDTTGIVLTGMGDDGVEGLVALHRAGAEVLAQDEASSIVYGMPGAAVASGSVDAIMPIDAIRARLIEQAVAHGAPVG